jgi:hypothetical protein
VDSVAIYVIGKPRLCLLQKTRGPHNRRGGLSILDQKRPAERPGLGTASIRFFQGVLLKSEAGNEKVVVLLYRSRGA